MRILDAHAGLRVGDSVSAAPDHFLPFTAERVTLIWEKDGGVWVQTGRGAAALSVPPRKLQKATRDEDR